MSATNDAGKLLLTPKGEYSGSTTYEVMDAVYYITSTVKGVYVAKGTTTGNLPTDTTKWKLLIDLGDFITDASLATSSTVGLVKPDGITDEVDALGILTALGVVIKAEVNTGATAYSATWLKVGTTTLTPSTKQMYRVTENSVECLYYWNGTNYAKIPAGHTIVNASGTAMTTRGKLKFTGATITDDPTNDQTVVAITGGGADSGMVEDLVKNTVGFTGKNRAYSQTNNAVIASIESGKTYSVSWTGSATITLKKDSASGTEITSGSTSPLTFTADADYDLYFGSSADVTQIMVCDSALDGEYEDYHESVESMFEGVADDIDGINRVKIFHPSQTINGITFTVSNGKIIASGTATDTAIFWCSLIADHYTIPAGNYHASGCPEQPSSSTQYHIGYLCTRNGSDNIYGNETGNGLDFEVLDGDVDLRVGIAIYSGYAIQGTLVFEPMLTEAKYAGIPYRPYNQQSIQHQINDITGKTGVRNLWRNNASSKTENGVTWIVNADGTITVSGTPTGNTYLHTKTPLKPGKYIVNGLAGTSNINYDVIALYKNNVAVSGFTQYAINNTGDTILDLSGYDFDELEIGPHRIQTNVAVSGTIKPMIRLASDPSDEYVPFAMTNRELTEVVTDKIIAEASANQTWASQLSSLYSAYNALTDEEKMRCAIYELNLQGNKFSLENATSGAFAYIGLNAAATALITHSINLSEQKLVTQVVTIQNSNLSITDNSATSHAVSLFLVMK